MDHAAYGRMAAVYGCRSLLGTRKADKCVR